jgi:predicted O-methyltransferase YrrM
MKTSAEAPRALATILERTRQVGFTMPSEAGTGSLLRALAASKPQGRMLEIGTGTGIATAWLLDGMDEASELVSVDVDASMQQIAGDVLGHDPRVRFVTDDASSFLLHREHESFDLIFADAMAGKYELLDETLALLKRGGLYVVDDMLPQPNWPPGHAPRVAELIATLTRRPDLHATRLDWASGIVVAARRG